MKNCIVMLIMLLVVATGCQEEQMTAWVGTSQETDLNLRVGVLDDKGTTEIGVEAEYERSDGIEPSYRPDRIGPYIIFWLTQEVTIEDTPEPSPLKDLLEALSARPYVGLNLMGVPDDGWRDIQPNIEVGSFFTIDPESDLGMYVAYKDGDNVVPGTYIGLAGRWLQF